MTERAAKSTLLPIMFFRKRPSFFSRIYGRKEEGGKGGGRRERGREGGKEGYYDASIYMFFARSLKVELRKKAIERPQ